MLSPAQRRYPGHLSWFLERTPSGYHDPDIIRADLRAAGFADCRIDTVVRTGHAASPRGVALGLCQGSPLRAEIEELDRAGSRNRCRGRDGGGALRRGCVRYAVTGAGGGDKTVVARRPLNKNCGSSIGTKASYCCDRGIPRLLRTGCHLGVAKHTGPIAKGQICGDDDDSALIEPADQVKQQLAAGLGEPAGSRVRRE
jgi:hypothetical protein